MSGQRGFTLAELLVGLAVLAVILSGILALQRQGQSAYLMGAARVEAQQNARTALDLIARELRTARSITGATACDVGGSSLSFVDQDGVPVTYRKNGATLEREANGAATVLIAGVQELTFRCYAADGITTTAAVASIRSVAIRLLTEPEDRVASYSPGHQQMVADSRVRLRNL